MRRAKTSLIALLCGFGALFAGLLYGEVTSLPPTTQHAKSAAKTVSPISLKPVSYTPPSQAAFADIDKHPLFVPQRRPTILDKPDGSKASDTQTEPPALTLIGIVIAGNHKTVIAKSASSVPAQHYSKGDKIDGWRVQDIAPNRVVLKKGDRSNTYTLQKTTPGQVIVHAQAQSNEQASNQQ